MKEEAGNVCFAFLSIIPPLVFVVPPPSPRPLNTRRDFHNLGRRLAPPYNIIIYAREGSLIRAPRGCKMADHVNAPLIFRDLARLPDSEAEAPLRHLPLFPLKIHFTTPIKIKYIQL